LTRKTNIPALSGNCILLVDDNLEYLSASRTLLEHEGHTVLTADNGLAALEVLRSQKVDLVLLDYYMPGMTGEEVVAQLRQFNSDVQVILQTGYSSEQPPRELLKRLDIQGYYDKSEGPEKFLLWTDVGLKLAYTVQLLTKSRQGLQYILDVTPEMHRIQSLTELLQGILWQVSGLLGVVNSFLAVVDVGGLRINKESEQTESFLAIINENTDLVIHASTGRFINESKISDVVDRNELKIIYESLKRGQINIFSKTTIVPLRVGDLTLGMIYLDRQVIPLQDQNLLTAFANQAAVAIQNTQLYEMATIDHLTGLYTRSFFEKCMYRELQTAFRSHNTLTLMMIDVDKFKKINDRFGHLVGDEALRTIGSALHQATRTADICGRYGGDEFTILLEGSRVVGQRIIQILSRKYPSDQSDVENLHCSLGLCVLEPNQIINKTNHYPFPVGYFETMGAQLIKRADEALYKSKELGGSQLQSSMPLHWDPLDQTNPPGIE
jgi:two-component system cell cycle response regulator